MTSQLLSCDCYRRRKRVLLCGDADRLICSISSSSSSSYSDSDVCHGNWIVADWSMNSVQLHRRRPVPAKHCMLSLSLSLCLSHCDAIRCDHVKYLWTGALKSWRTNKPLNLPHCARNTEKKDSETETKDQKCMAKPSV